jgi:hypothetical protein
MLVSGSGIIRGCLYGVARPVFASVGMDCVPRWQRFVCFCAGSFVPGVRIGCKN